MRSEACPDRGQVHTARPSRTSAAIGCESGCQVHSGHVAGRRTRPSLDPVFQGMIRNAPGGPASAAGTPLVRMGHGRYVLADAAAREQIMNSARDRAARSRAAVVSLAEDEVKQGARDFLEGAGFRVTVAWGHQRGIDIEAVSAAEVLLLEAKGSAQNPP